MPGWPKSPYQGKLRQAHPRSAGPATDHGAAERLRLLFEHYGIPPPNLNRDLAAMDRDGLAWLLLAVSLARQHVPAMHPPRQGRPKSKDTDAAIVARHRLAAIVKRHKAQHAGSSIQRTCAWLADHGWKKLPPFYRDRPKLSAKTLAADVTRARKERAPFLRWLVNLPEAEFDAVVTETMEELEAAGRLS